MTKPENAGKSPRKPRNSADRSEAERMANVGVPVTLSFAEVRVRELVLEDIVELAQDLAIVLEEVPVDEGKGLAWIAGILKRPQTLAAVRRIAAASTGRKPADFENLGIADWLKLLVAFKTVMDFAELRELFFALVPPGLLETLRPKTRSRG